MRKDQSHNHLWIHNEYDWGDLSTVSGCIQYQKLFVSLQKLFNLYFCDQELFVYSQLYQLRHEK